jgi:hypothetical protein
MARGPMNSARLLLGILIGSQVCPPARADSGRSKQETRMDAIEQQVNEKFAEFEKTRDPVFVYEILDSIEAAESAMPQGDVAARKLAVSRRLRFFAALDHNIDPSWNPKDVPPHGVPPPPGWHGMVYSSGEVDPEKIPDAEVRAKYVEALKANKAAQQHYSVQLQLRRIDERAMRFFERFLIDRYSNTEQDLQEFEGLLAASPVNEMRKQRLRALMPKPQPPRSAPLG